MTLQWTLVTVILMKYGKKLLLIKQSMMQKEIIEMSQTTPMCESGGGFVLLLMSKEQMGDCHNLEYMLKGMQLIFISHQLLRMTSTSQNLCNALLQ